jgi:hypothetical protein
MPSKMLGAFLHPASYGPLPAPEGVKATYLFSHQQNDGSCIIRGNSQICWLSEIGRGLGDLFSVDVESAEDVEKFLFNGHLFVECELKDVK